MSFDLFLEKQLRDFITVYKPLFKKTFGVTIILSFLYLLAIAALHIYFGSAQEPGGGKTSLSSYLWYRFSVSEYQFVDMSKSILLFVISFFSIALSRKVIRDKENLNVHFGSFFDEMKPGDFGYLLLALVGCLVMDYLLYQVVSNLYVSTSKLLLAPWIYAQIHFLRIYLPLLLFSYINKLALTNNKSFFTVKECLFVLAALWLFNEMAYEFAVLIKGRLFLLLLAPIPPGSRFFAESILELPLIAVLFLGYHSAITNSALLFQNDTKPEQLPATEQTLA